MIAQQIISEAMAGRVIRADPDRPVRRAGQATTVAMSICSSYVGSPAGNAQGIMALEAKVAQEVIEYEA